MNTSVQQEVYPRPPYQFVCFLMRVEALDNRIHNVEVAIRSGTGCMIRTFSFATTNLAGTAESKQLRRHRSDGMLNLELPYHRIAIFAVTRYRRI